MPQALLNLRTTPNYGSTGTTKDHEASPRHRLKSWYMQMFLINLVEFSAESSRGIVLPTLFLYGKSLGGSIAFMGILTSVFSVGRLISSTVFGWMCDRWTFKAVYIISSVICLFGNVLYLLADEHVVNSKYLLAISRFIVGFGAGNRSVCRANVAAITTVSQRLKYLTILATVVFLGYALTPGFGSLVANIDVYLLGVHFNQFTSPGMILVILSGFTIVLVLLFHEEDLGIHDGPCETPDNRNPDKKLENSTHLPTKVVNMGAAIFIFLNFNARGILSVFETINIPLFLEVTGSSSKRTESVVAASNFQFYLGLLGLITYLLIEYFRHKISDVCWVQTGFSMLFVGNLLLVVAPSNLTFLRLTLSEVFVWSIGCPITSAVIVAAFSKLLGGRPQGTLMGLLGSAGSVSRIVLPLLPGVLATLSPVFCINLVLCGISIVSLAWYSRLVYAHKEGLTREAQMSTSQGSGQA
ncbi:hypothetical protein ABG067_000964 [Albugo candida]